MNRQPSSLTRSLPLIALLAFAVPPPDANAQGGISFREPANSRVTVWNNYGSTIQVYAVDRWGGWKWGESVGKGDTTTFRSPDGQLWNVADKRGRVVKQFRAQTGKMTVAVERDGGEAELTVRTDRPFRPGIGVRPDLGDRWERSELEIKNKTDFPVMVYEVNRWGSWTFRAVVRSGDEFEVRATEGTRWMVTTRQGRRLKEFQMRDRDTKIDVKD
jgi:hypothetical protein